MIMKFSKGAIKEVGGDGTGWTMDSPFYWYRHTTDWHITSGLNTSGSPASSERSIYFRVKLKGGTAYSLGTYGDFDGKCWLYNESGAEVTYNDDGSCDVNGEYYSYCIWYTPSADGIFFFRAGAYSDGQGDIRVCCYPAPEVEEIPQSTTVYETSSGFNALGNPIRYRSASGAGIEYSPIDIPKDGLVFYADYKNGKDRVTKTVGECSNVTFEKHNGCDCAYFNGVDSSILWKNILTSDLQYYTIFTKFATLPKEHWGMILGLSPENKRTQGYSMKTHYKYLTYCHHGNDRGAVRIPFDTWGVGVLVGYGEWIELYYNGEVNVGYSAGSIPANSWLYNGIDFGYTNVDPQPYYGYIAESIVYNRTFTKEELQALTQQLLNKGA